MSCPDDNRILAFFEDQLEPAAAAEVEHHLDHCPRCRRLFSRIARALSEERDEHDTRPVGERPDTLRLAMGGTLVDSIVGGAGSGEPPDHLHAPGHTVGHFRILRLLGRGGMGEVYLARDLRLGRKVALKMVRPEAIGSKQAVERFMFEARTTARFNHPHIVTIHEVGVDQGRPFLALEYLQGQTLRDRIAHDRPKMAEILRIGLAIVDALKAAHASGVLHRDLKPENVVLAQDGRMRVLDFGLAKAQDRTELAEPISPERVLGDGEPTRRRKGICGSPAYMAPEQWMGVETTGATDIWALGVVLFKMVTGHHPYQGLGLRELNLQVCSEDPAPPVGTASGLSRLIEQCMQKDPALRPTAVELMGRLQELANRDVGEIEAGIDPFRGLLPFAESHRRFFCGRDTEITHFVERLREEPAVAVVGASGAGKTSFVQAGVIPRLRERGPLIVIQLRPGTRPFLTLASRIIAARQHPTSSSSPFGRSSDPTGEPTAQEGAEGEGVAQLAKRLQGSPPLLNMALHQIHERQRSSVLLYIDQLEELFTLTSDRAMQARFMEAISTAADDPEVPVRLVITLREEFLSRVAEGAEARATLDRIMVLRSPGAAMLSEALIRPLETVGYAFDDPSVVEEMVEEVRDEVACLPLLQFAGQLLWEHRDVDRHELLRSSYEALGGVAGALARHADGVLSGLPPSSLQLARALLLRLVTADGTRRVLARTQLLAGLGEDADQVLDRLVSARLITARQGEVRSEVELELVHESLIVTWARLRRWIEESREELAFLAEIGQAAELWDKRGRRFEEVWRGDALRDALRKVDRCTTKVPELVLAFLRAGAEKYQRFTRRRRWRRAAVVAVLSITALVALVVAAILSKQKRAIEEQRAEAQREGARAAQRWDDLLEARAKLRTSLETQDSALARSLWWRLSADPLVWKRRVGSVVHRIDISPDGQLIAAASSDRLIYLLDSKTRAVRRVLRGHGDQVLSVAFSQDGRRLASGGWDGEVRLWDLRSGTGRAVQGRHDGGVWDLSFGPRDQLVASGGSDKVIRIWDAESGRQRLALIGHEDAVFGLDFNPARMEVASGGRDRSVRIWDVRRGRALRVITGHAHVYALRYSPDGELLATGGADMTVRLWNPAAGRPVRVLLGHTGAVWGLGFSPDGKLLATGGLDHCVRLWEVETGQQRQVLRGHEEMILGVRFGPRGRFLATGSTDKSIRLWETTRGGHQRQRQGHSAMVMGLDFSPDGKLLATGGKDRMIRLWDVQTGRQQRVIEGHSAKVFDVEFSPDGKLLASGSTDKSVRLWEVQTGKQRHVLIGHGGKVANVSFSPDGKHLASASSDGTVRIWIVKEGRQQRVLSGHSAQVHGVCYSPDGTVLASAGADRTVRLWEADTGRQRASLQGHRSEVWGVSFSPDGRTLASASTDRTLRLWDLGPGKELASWQHPGRVYWPAFHPDGRRVGAPGSDGVARIWSVGTEEQITLRGHRAECNGIAFSPDGELAATSSDDATVRIWRVESGRSFWRAPVLLSLGGRVQLYSHQGWVDLDAASGSSGSPISSRQGWRLAVSERAKTAAADEDGRRLCIGTYGGRLELWEIATDRRLLSVTAPRLQRVIALPRGCLALADGRVKLYDRSGRVLDLETGRATTVALDGADLLVADHKQVRLFTAAGKQRGDPTYDVDVGVTAIGRSSEWLILGFRDGNIELVSLRSGKRRSNFSFEEVPASPVERLLVGPMNTVVAGYANGLLGIWNLQTGKRLEHARLHGPVIHLLLRKRKLYAATELGSHLVWDLGELYMDYCDLLRDVWSRVPVVLEGGLPVLRPPPRGHRCWHSR
jgi:WD40 repeat protein/serine/threonine protein kinase